MCLSNILWLLKETLVFIDTLNKNNNLTVLPEPLRHQQSSGVTSGGGLGNHNSSLTQSTEGVYDAHSHHQQNQHQPFHIYQTQQVKRNIIWIKLKILYHDFYPDLLFWSSRLGMLFLPFPSTISAQRAGETLRVVIFGKARLIFWSRRWNRDFSIAWNGFLC